MTNVYRRGAAALVGTVLAGVAAALAATGATAAPNARPAAVPASVVTQARTVLHARSTVARVTRFFATEPGAHRAAATGTPTLAATPVPVYVLSPGFVRSGAGPVATLSVLATTATAADSRTASVWAAPGADGHWKVVNIASGADETTYAKKAGTGTAFHEPQLDAWYALRGDTVRPLNAAARTQVGTGESVAAYQRQVHRRYADRLPGSRYAKTGLAGGYGPATGPAGTRGHADRSTGTPARAAAAPDQSPWTLPALAGGLVALVALLGAGLLLRRRRA
jgi:hypothetical protein